MRFEIPYHKSLPTHCKNFESEVANFNFCSTLDTNNEYLGIFESLNLEATRENYSEDIRYTYIQENTENVLAIRKEYSVEEK